VGVDLQKKFCQLASSNLQNRFPGQNWTIKQQSLTDFFNDGTSLKLIKPELIGFNLKGEKACLML
jgi:hypothetical protein